jgi:hypothetical protein
MGEGRGRIFLVGGPLADEEETEDGAAWFIVQRNRQTGLQLDA